MNLTNIEIVPYLVLAWFIDIVKTVQSGSSDSNGQDKR